jgi:hypothetical protein
MTRGGALLKYGFSVTQQAIKCRSAQIWSDTSEIRIPYRGRAHETLLHPPLIFLNLAHHPHPRTSPISSVHWPSDSSPAEIQPVSFYRSPPTDLYWHNFATMGSSDYDSEEWEDYSAEKIGRDLGLDEWPRWPKEDEYEDMVWTIENHHAVYSASVGRNIVPATGGCCC